MKFAIGISVICCFCYIGFTIRSQLIERHKFYNDVLNLINQFNININFYKNSVENFLENYQSNSELRKVISFYLGTKFKNNNQILCLKHITNDECKKVLEIFNQIGCTDTENQETLLKGFENEISLFCAETKEELNKYGTVALKISTIIGVLIVILLI